MKQLEQVKERELALSYVNESEFIKECKEAIKSDYNYSDILAETIFVKAYSKTSYTVSEFFNELEDYCKNIRLVMEA